MSDYREMHDYLTARKAELDADFERQRAVFRDIQEYIAPYTGQGLSGSYAEEKREGHRKDSKILDSTATRAVRVCASGLYGDITSPSRPWFSLTLPDQDLAAYPPVKAWLFAVQQRMYFLFARSGAYHAFHSMFRELTTYGTAAMGMFANFKTAVRVRPFTCGEYRFGLSNDYDADSFSMSQYMSAKQIIQEFGIENVSTQVKEAYENKRAEQLFEVCWLVEPNDDRLEHKDFMDWAYRSVYWEPGKTESGPLEISGYSVFPMMVPRWDVVGGRAWGVGVGHDIIGHTKQLQKLQERSLVILDKQSDPPLVGPSALRNGASVNAMPGGITAIDEMSNTPGIRQLYQIQADMQALAAQIQDTRQQIREGAFNDIFMMLANSVDHGKTATEVAGLKEEKLAQLGPFLERQDKELLNKSIDLLFSIMTEHDPMLIPPPPPEIQGSPLQIEYVNILTQAQKLAGLNPTNTYLMLVGNMMQMGFMEARYKVSTFDLLNNAAEILNVAPDTVPDDEMAAQRMQADQQAAAQAQQMQAAPEVVKSAKVLSETKLDDNSALDTLLGREQSA